MRYIWLELAIVGGLLIGLLSAVELGYYIGRVARRRSGGDLSALGAIQGAMLGLLGLMLGFSFAGAATRFVARQDLVVREANAIGTAFLRADLLDETARLKLRETLRAYAASRVALFEELSLAGQAELRSEAALLHDQLWTAAAAGVRESPQFDLAVLNPVNEVIDLHTERTAAMDRHLPTLVLTTLIVSAVVGVGTLAYGNGLTGHRNFVSTIALAVLISLALWVTIDLDYPRVGLIRINQRPMIELRESLAESSVP